MCMRFRLPHSSITFASEDSSKREIAYSKINPISKARERHATVSQTYRSASFLLGMYNCRKEGLRVSSHHPSVPLWIPSLLPLHLR